MTPEQFDRWRDFALRMARTCYADSRRPSGAWVEEHVRHFIDCVDWEEVVDWDRAPAYVCDQMTTFEVDCMPYFRFDPEDDTLAAAERAEQRERRAEEQWRDQWFGPVRCCVRAGLDLASEPSAGVVGFTIGDLRAMYPEGVPAWICEGFVDGETGEPAAVCTMPDSTGVWL